ncbi:MAG TPA: PD-(D/E)XK nuclease family protein [Rectinemataceae bacterium]|nr:PD-(D/E)XK nuclease family protein [Rectinemataceae bacterium]
MSDADEALDAEIEAFLEERFADNLTILETEQRLRINAFVREQALLQVKLYWRKLRDLALRVTQSELPMTLSNQRTKEGRSFTISGVADIVEEGGKNILYDIKTHDPDFVVAHRERYEAQLNIYAKIWSDRNGATIDETAVIATPLPGKLKYALSEGNQAMYRRAMEEWNPIIPIGYREENVTKTLEEFAETVDDIESCRFDPPPVAALEAPMGAGRTVFGRKICRNCDIRFACESYRDYALKARRLSTDDLLGLLRELGDEGEADAFKTLALAEDVAKEFEASTVEREDEKGE